MKPIINDFTLRPRIEERQPVIAIACRLTGRYETLPYPEAWECIMKCCTDNHLPYLDQGVEYINVFHDDPTEIRAENCRADVCLAAAADCPSAQADIRRMRLEHHDSRRSLPRLHPRRPLREPGQDLLAHLLRLSAEKPS